MDRGVLHKSSALVGEMGEGHGWWSVNNLRPPFHEQHNPSLFLPSSITTTSSTTPSSPLHSFSSLLLSNHYPLPTPASTTAAPWHDSSSSSRLGQQLPDAWSHILQMCSCTSCLNINSMSMIDLIPYKLCDTHITSSGGLANNGEEGYKNNWEAGQVLFPSTPAAAEAADGGSGYNIYSNTASHGSSSTSDDAQFVARSSPWGGIHQHHHHHNALQQQASAAVAASSPRSSCITSSTSLGSNMLEFSNNSSPREGISTASGVAFKKARTQQEPSPAQSTVKVRKEKLGDRITALHQLVSPFGKTDTASVLLEAIGYIRFLHGQIEALSSPYLGSGGNGGGGAGCSSSSKQQQQQEQEATRVQGERKSIFPEDPGDQDESCEETKKRDLRSRGLCLVPVSCTVDVGVDVGPSSDYWAAAPGFGIGFGR